MNSIACSGSGFGRRPGKKWRAGQLAGLFALGGILAGCQAAPPNPANSRRDFRPDNVFASTSKLALNFRRVAVLPLAAETADGDLPEGCTALTPVLLEQLIKTKKFEVVPVDTATLRRAHRPGELDRRGKSAAGFFRFPAP